MKNKRFTNTYNDQRPIHTYVRHPHTSKGDHGGQCPLAPPRLCLPTRFASSMLLKLSHSLHFPPGENPFSSAAPTSAEGSVAVFVDKLSGADILLEQFGGSPLAVRDARVSRPCYTLSLCLSYRVGLKGSTRVWCDRGMSLSARRSTSLMSRSAHVACCASRALWPYEMVCAN